jgi:hypothetical protein
MRAHCVRFRTFTTMSSILAAHSHAASPSHVIMHQGACQSLFVKIHKLLRTRGQVAHEKFARSTGIPVICKVPEESDLSARTIGEREREHTSIEIFNRRWPLSPVTPPARARCSTPARRRRARPLPSSPTALDGGRPYASALPRWSPGSSPPHSPGSAP